MICANVFTFDIKCCMMFSVNEALSQRNFSKVSRQMLHKKRDTENFLKSFAQISNIF